MSKLKSFVADRYPSTPMAIVGRNGKTYTLCDPAGPYSVDPATGGVALKRHVTISALFAVALAPIGGLWNAVANPYGWWWTLPSFVLGALEGFVAGAIVSIPFVGASWAYQRVASRLRGSRGFLEVTDTASRAWRVCDVAWQIADTDSWRDRTVDPERRIASIVWSAVQRIVGSEREYPDAARALSHPSLQEIAEVRIRKIERERESLRLVEANLQKVVDAARAIDAARARTAREREVAKRRQAEEQELRGRLIGTERRRPIDSDVSERPADESAGLVAEAQAVAGWLAESDQLLRDV